MLMCPAVLHICSRVGRPSLVVERLPLGVQWRHVAIGAIKEAGRGALLGAGWQSLYASKTGYMI